MTNAIKKALAAELKTVCDNVFFKRGVPVYPHLRCSLRRLGAGELPVYQYLLYIDFTGRRGDDGELDDIAEKVSRLLDRTICTNDIVMQVAVEEVQEEDDNKNDIRTIIGSYSIRAYYKE